MVASEPNLVGQHPPFKAEVLRKYSTEITVPRALIALLAALAVFAVLVSPAPDELPGTAAHFNHALAFATVFLALRFGPDLLGESLSELVQLPILNLPDLLALQCTRLC